jgi:hypothetical protein
MSIKTSKQLKNIGFIRYVQFYVLCLLLFVAGLRIPGASTGAIIFAIPMLLLSSYLLDAPLLRVNNSLFKHSNFVICVFLLTAFCFSFYETSYSYGLIPGAFPLPGIMRIIIPYLLGACLDYRKLPYFPFNIIFLVLSYFGGGTLYVLLCLSKIDTKYERKGFSIDERSAPDFWGTSDFINGPSLDLFNYFGMCLFPLLIYAFYLAWCNRKARKIVLPLAAMALLVFSIGLYSSLALQARTPIICLLASTFIAFFYGVYASKGKFSWNKLALICLGSILIILGTIALDSLNFSGNVAEQLKEENLLIRFDQMGLDTPRWETWQKGLTGVLDYPLGGRQYELVPGVYSIHNLWLDVAYDAGLFPFLAIGIFHLLHLTHFRKVISANIPFLLKIFVACFVVAFISGFMGTPVMQASIDYFAMSCFFIGIVLAMASDNCKIFQSSTY